MDELLDGGSQVILVTEREGGELSPFIEAALEPGGTATSCLSRWRGAIDVAPPCSVKVPGQPQVASFLTKRLGSG